MIKSLFLTGLLFCPLSFPAESQEPSADFGIYTLVSSGPRLFEGRRLRAIVIYGELGVPSISIESIQVEMGAPSPSKVLWSERIDWAGGVNQLCQEPGIWRCSLEDLKWEGSTLHYRLESPDGTYSCRIEIAGSPRIKAGCSKP